MAVMVRLPAQPLTETDYGIFLWMAARLKLSIEEYMLASFTADIRDADLMLILTDWRRSPRNAWNRALVHALGGQLP